MKNIKRFVFGGLFPSIVVGVLFYGQNTHLYNGDVSIAFVYPNIEKKHTYSDLFKSRGRQIVDNSTTTDSLKNILLSRMFPNYKSNHVYAESQLFAGSPQITLTGQDVKNGSPKLFIMGKNGDEDVNKFKDSCVSALSKMAEEINSEFYRLQEWCTVPKVQDVLKRHKFKLASTDDHWKSIIDGEWLKNENRTKQSFLSEEDLKDWDSKDETSKIALLKNKCNEAMNKPFVRENFPAPKAFLDSLPDDRNKKVDEFQEASLFCVEPKTAKSYVKEAMNGVTAESMPEYMKNDFCYVTGKDDLSYYKDIKTTDSMDGKSFWCAVRMIYGRYNVQKSK